MSMPGRNAVDRVLEMMADEYTWALGQLKKLRDLAAKTDGGEKREAKRDKYYQLKGRVESHGRDDDGEAINPLIETAVGYIEDYDIPNIGEVLAPVLELIKEKIEVMEAEMEELSKVREETPEGAFFANRDDDDDDDDDE